MKDLTPVAKICCVLTQLEFLFSQFPYMMYTCPTHLTLFIYLFFPSLFSHQISFLFLQSPSCLFLRSSSSPKIQFFFFTQKTRRKKYITHQKKKKKREKKP